MRVLINNTDESECYRGVKDPVAATHHGELRQEFVALEDGSARVTETGVL